MIRGDHNEIGMRQADSERLVLVRAAADLDQRGECVVKTGLYNLPEDLLLKILRVPIGVKQQGVLPTWVCQRAAGAEGRQGKLAAKGMPVH